MESGASQGWLWARGKSMATGRKQRFCTECGRPLDEGSQFCPYCGHECKDPEGAKAAPAARDSDGAPDGAGNANASEMAGAGEGKAGPKRKAIVAVCVVAAILAVSLGGYVGWRAYQAHAKEEAKEAYDSAYEKRAVALRIVAPNYTKGATRIPLHVTGTDLDGKKVDTVLYVSGNGEKLRLRQGAYQVQPVASPILDDGTIYTCPRTAASVTVGAGASSWSKSSNSASSASSQGSSKKKGASSGKASITFEVPKAADVTDQMIADAKKAAAADPKDGGKAEKLAEVAKKKRDDAVAAQKEAEEKAAEEKVAQQKKAWYQKYADVIKAQEDGIDSLNVSSGGGSGSRYLEWALYDVDGDGSPELLTRCVNDSMASGDNLACIAGISGGTASELVDFHVEVRDWYYLSTNGVLRESGSGGAYTGGDTYYHVTSSGVEKFAEVEWDMSGSDDLDDENVAYTYSNSEEGIDSETVDQDFEKQLLAKYPTTPLTNYDWTTNPLG